MPRRVSIAQWLGMSDTHLLLSTVVAGPLHARLVSLLVAIALRQRRTARIASSCPAHLTAVDILPGRHNRTALSLACAAVVGRCGTRRACLLRRDDTHTMRCFECGAGGPRAGHVLGFGNDDTGGKVGEGESNRNDIAAAGGDGSMKAE